MAGLTKEQRAAKAQTVETTHDDGLVLMQKNGEELNVHPTCVKAHESAGWKVKD